MTAGTAIVLALVLAAIALAVVILVRNRKGCEKGHCAGCQYSDSCGRSE